MHAYTAHGIPASWMASWTARGLLHTTGGRIVESHHTERMFGMMQCLAQDAGSWVGRLTAMVITTAEPLS